MRIKVNKNKRIFIRVDSTEYYVFKMVAESRRTTISKAIRDLVKEEYKKILGYK